MQEEPQSVADILSSIRTVLSREAETLKTDVSTVQKPTIQPIQEEAIFELTPQMQVSKGTLITPQTVMKTQASLEKLNQIKPQANNGLTNSVEEQLKPMLQDWLNTHLPDIVERIVTQEVKRIINNR
ncbi:MAG: DUF2497 domain-containing protein [Alphaproteobacteria bacterium]|nr:DUF2497 domain-containing protein [Alphaproteobacteria bacterium]MBQ3117581.1 DUF2497 domain-containing protein [Alphaproteobacteria bacterium]MBQ6855083.1 DUF2497 domain-containing protein [Alphaproteobacteria bacterium]MBQ8557704.1 DUF2497 domain-containing protein [Alphaproteobacteria bacterium]MBR3912777.1 DUF2497 domain-containing protein [Alphaproteobacteria bacterium]